MTRTFTLGLIMLAMVGCGSSGSSNGTTSSQGSTTASQASAPNAPPALTATIEAICARRNSTITSSGVEYTTEKELKHLAVGRLAVEKTALAELSKLKTPATMEPEWQQFITYRRQLVEKWTTIAKSGLHTSDILGSAAVAEERMLAAAKRGGLKQCAQPA